MDASRLVDAEWPPLREPSAERVWRDILQPVGVNLRQQASELAADIVTDIRDELPGLLTDPQMFEEGKNSAADSLRQIGQMVARGDSHKNIDLPSSTRAIIRLAVWRSVSLAEHGRFYRLAQERLLHWLFPQIAKSTDDPGTLATAVELTTSWVLGFVDRALLVADRAYEDERETWSRGASAARAAAIEDILADRERDAQTASTRLRHEVARHHIGVVARLVGEPQHGDALSVLSEAIASAARLAGADGSITHPAGSLAIAGWLSARRPFPAETIPPTQEGLRAWRIPLGVSIAVGEQAFGLKGFRATHVEAQHASRVSMLVNPEQTSFTRYREAALTALCTADDDHAAMFAQRALGPLAENDKDSDRLAVTLAVYLRENLSRTRTADVLQIHPNTVSYRVRQAEELLQRSFERDTLDLQVALGLLPALTQLRRGRPGGP